MGRVHVQDVVLDTADFTPLQLQTRFALRGAAKGWFGWSLDYVTPFNELLAKHRLGMVIVASDVRWTEPFHYYDAPTAQVRTAVRIRRDGLLLEAESDVEAGGKVVMKSLHTLRPIRVTDATLAAEPGEVAEWFFAGFADDEMFDTPLLVRLEARLRAADRRAEHVASGVHNLRVRRNDTEFADQWSFIEIPGLAAAAREELVLGNSAPELAGSLGRPLARVEAKLTRPLYVYDEACVVTDVFRLEDGLEFVHRIESRGGRHRHATVVETLATGAS